jgi:hypothetical protein
MRATKTIRYIIGYDNLFPSFPFTLFETYEVAEKKRLFISEKEGKVYKVTIELSNGARNGKKTNRRNKRTNGNP